MDLAAGDGWSKLCPFLGKPVPDAPFPHLNRAEDGGGVGGVGQPVRRGWRRHLGRRHRVRVVSGKWPAKTVVSSVVTVQGAHVRRWNSGPEIIHAHIPKAAGTTFDAVLESVYGEEHVERDQSADTPRSLRGDRDAWRARMQAEVEPRTSWPRVITGHFSLRRYERFRRSAFTIVWLREPAGTLALAVLLLARTMVGARVGAAWALAFPPSGSWR